MNTRVAHAKETAHRSFRSEIFTAQAVTETAIYYFHVAADKAEEVLERLAERDEYSALQGVRRVEVFEGELFARYDGQLPIKLFTLD